MKKKIGLIMTEDSEAWGGEEGVGKYFSKQFTNTDNSLQYEVIHGISGTPPRPDQFSQYSAFVFSGSHYSVNDPYDWIKNLVNFIQQVHEHNKTNEPIKLVGICYGHQLIAKALGGVVQPITHPNKFLFGSEKIDVSEKMQSLSWFKEVFGNGDKFHIMEVHGEEVSQLPNEATPVGASETCKYEVLVYGNHFLTFQGHPEFTKEKMDELAERAVKRGSINEELKKLGVESAKRGQTEQLMKLVCQFLKH